MKLKSIIFFLGAGIIIASCGGTKKGGKGAKLGNSKDSVSYSFGMSIGNNLKKVGITDLDMDILVKGISDVITPGDSTILNEKTATELVQTYFGKLQEKKFGEAKKDGDAFLEKNKTKEGVKVLPSGLQYKVIKEGAGNAPAIGQKVRVHYTGKLIDGKVFDSSVERGEPAEFPVDGVIKGWQEALKMMPVGSKWEVVIPSDLAYGPNGTPDGTIPPNSVLLFEMELLEILK